MEIGWSARLVSLLLVFAVALSSGCSLVNGTTQRVSIATSVPGAQVFVDGAPVGRTDEGKPVVVSLKRRSDHVVVATKEGYSSRAVRIENELSGLGTLDLIGTWLILLPGISFLMGTAWELQPKDVYVALDPVASPQKNTQAAE